MRITIDIPDVLYRQLIAKSAREKRSVEGLILRGVEAGLRLLPVKKRTPSPSDSSLEVPWYSSDRQRQDL